MSQMQFNISDLDKLKKNIINYQEKLANQSKELFKLAEAISQDWTGKNAKQTIDAIQASATAYKKVSDNVNQYVPATRVIVNALEKVHQ